MKVLEVIASIDPAGGGPIEGIIRQNDACVRSRIDIERELVTLDPPDSALLETFPMKVHALGFRRTEPQSPWRRLLDYWGYAPGLKSWLRDNVGSYDAVIVNGLWNYAPFAASRVLPGGSTPYFVFAHGMMDPWFRKASPLKHVAKQAFWLVGEGRLLAGATSVFFTTEEEKLAARGQFWGHSYEETVVGYGTAAPPALSPFQAEAFHAATPSLGDRPYLLYLSRIHPKKGCDLLIEAFAATCNLQPELQLVIAGPGTPQLVDMLRRQAERLGIGGRVHWPGMLQGDAKWGAFYGAEAFVLPSHQENFGIVVAEALACGTPVLISDKVNIWREVEAASAGLINADTSQGAEALLRRWFAADKVERDAMRQAARKLFREKFDVVRNAPALIETIRMAV